MNTPNLKACIGTSRDPHPWIQYQVNPHRPNQCPLCAEMQRQEQRELRRAEVLCSLGNDL